AACLTPRGGDRRLSRRCLSALRAGHPAHEARNDGEAWIALTGHKRLHHYVVADLRVCCPRPTPEADTEVCHYISVSAVSPHRERICQACSTITDVARDSQRLPDGAWGRRCSLARR